MQGEILNFEELGAPKKKQIVSDPISYIEDYLRFDNYPESSKALGFKLLYNHLTPEFFYGLDIPFTALNRNVVNMLDGLVQETEVDLLFGKFEKAWQYLIDDESINVIHLKRDNKFEILVSLKTAFITNQWMEIPGQRSSPEIMLELKPEDCRLFFEQIELYESAYTETFKKHQTLEVDYHDLVNSMDAVIRETFEFIGVTPIPVAPVLKKQIKSPLNEIVKNYDELKLHFEGTKWAHYFSSE